jgi:hypothetical protein
MNLSAKQKKVLTIGGAALVAVTGLSLIFGGKKKTPKKRDYGIKADNQCNTYTVTDERKIHDELWALVRAQDVPDPFQISRSFLRKATPNCTVYPNNTRNPGEAALFVLTFNTTLDIMAEENLVSEAQVKSFKDMVKIWAIGQGVNPSDF